MKAPFARNVYEKFMGGMELLLRDRKARKEQSDYGSYDAHGVRQGGLIAFVRYFWHVLEPQREFIDGWPLWAMCEHLEAVTRGEINRLLITVPPGFMKSMLVDVFWPAWEWGPMGRSHYRYVAFSYSAHLTERDNLKFRDLIAHPSYQNLYGPFTTRSLKGEDFVGVGLRNKTTLKVMNNNSGWKLASSVGGVGTGERGDRVICDDLHNVKEAESETVRAETVRWFRESVSTRFNDLSKDALIIIMQRVHEEDVAGVVLELGLDYCHLMIPWYYEANRQVDDKGNIVRTPGVGWVDPRCDEHNPDANDGEPAWPERFSDAAIARLRAELTTFAWAGQFQQRPMPRGGGIFQREWWQVFESTDGKFPAFDYVIASLDGAFTEKEENDPCALTVWGIFQKGEHRRIMLIRAWRKRLPFSGPRIEREPNETEAAYRHRTQPKWGLIEWVAWSCRRWKVDKLLIEAKANGISAAQELQNRYPGEPWSIQLCQVKGDKVARALAVQPTFSQGLVYAPTFDWSEIVIDEMAVFPKGRYDDLTDSTTQALSYLRGVGLAQTTDEAAVSLYDQVRHKPRQRALYPV